MKRIFGLIAILSGVIVIAVNVIFKLGESASTFLIGPDGPTVFFVARKGGADLSTAGIVGGIALIISAIFLLVWKKK